MQEVKRKHRFFPMVLRRWETPLIIQIHVGPPIKGKAPLSHKVSRSPRSAHSWSLELEWRSQTMYKIINTWKDPTRYPIAQSKSHCHQDRLGASNHRNKNKNLTWPTSIELRYAHFLLFKSSSSSKNLYLKNLLISLSKIFFILTSTWCSCRTIHLLITKPTCLLKSPASLMVN